MDYKISYRTSVPHLAASTCLDMGNAQYVNGGRNGNETLKGCGLGVTYSRPGDYFLPLFRQSERKAVRSASVNLSQSATVRSFAEIFSLDNTCRSAYYESRKIGGDRRSENA